MTERSGFELQASFIDRLHAQVVALNDEFGEHREAAADAKARFVEIVEDFGREAKELELDEMQRQVGKLGQPEVGSWTSIDPSDPAAALDESLAAALARIDAISRRQAMHRTGASLQDLQRDFFTRVENELRRIQAVLTTAKRGVLSDTQLDPIKKTMHSFIWEADALEVSAPVRLMLMNLSLEPAGLTNALRMVEVFWQSNARNAKGSHPTDK